MSSCPARRRRADPATVLQLWAAVDYIRSQKQIPNQERIVRYMHRNHDVDNKQSTEQLSMAVSDGLLVAYTTVGTKGSKVGTEQEGYKVPEAADSGVERDGHDWYCFECHQPGEVLLCGECWRVFHPRCTDAATATRPRDGGSGQEEEDAFVCHLCTEMKKKPRMKRKEINRLLGFTVQRLKEKVRAKELHRLLPNSGAGGKDGGEVPLERMVYRAMDLATMEQRTKDRKYKYLDQFLADARTIVHNTFIIYGANTTLGNLAKIMIRDCTYDLDEIRHCKECYYYSNAKPKDWFCQPCRPPHELVYAKQKGFCYWPAKVIKVTKEGHDVRFFGGWHQRAIIPSTSIKSIELSPKELHVKKTTGFTKALEELRRHQDLLRQLGEEEEGEEETGAGDAGGDDASEEEDQGQLDQEEEMDDAPVKEDKKRKRHTSDGAEMPEIKHKKFRKKQREEEVSSSGHQVGGGDSALVAAAAADDLVTSSMVDTPRVISTSDTGTQTSKKLTGGGRPLHKGIQADLPVTSGGAPTLQLAGGKCAACGSDAGKQAPLPQRFAEYKARLDQEMAEERERMEAELEERLQAELEKAGASGDAPASSSSKKSSDSNPDTKKMAAKHKAEISACKKKQWCYNCEEEAMYHCCWNTSYCSIKCQQEHWHREHKRMCRRKRNEPR